MPARAAGPARRATGWISRSSAHFYFAVLGGFVVWVATWGQHPALRILLAGDVMFAIYIGQMLAFSLRASPDAMRARATDGKLGPWLMIVVAVLAVLLSLVAIFTLLNHPKADGRYFPVVAVASVPLSWAMVHTVAAFNYARLYYAPGASGHPQAGLEFPRGGKPAALDFLYYAFVIGMSFSVSDVSTTSRPLRLATLVHGVASFAFNTVLIAIAVNAAMTLAQ